MSDVTAAADLYLEWEQALNEPEVDVALVASLESQAKSVGLDLWQINNRLLNSMPHAVTAAIWNPLLHPRGFGGRFIEVGDLVGFFRGGKEERGTVRAIKPDGKLVVEMDRRGGGINVRAMTVDPRDVRPLGVKGFLRGDPDAIKPDLPVLEQSYQQAVERMREFGVPENRIPDQARWEKSTQSPPPYRRGQEMEEANARRAEREGRMFDVGSEAPEAHGRPFAELSDDALRETYQRTVDAAISDVDPQLVESLYLDAKYLQEEFEIRGLSRGGAEDRPFKNLSDEALIQAYMTTNDRLIGDVDPQLLESLELDVEYFREEFANRGLPRLGEAEELGVPRDTFDRITGDRPFANLSDTELQQAYRNTINRLIQDIDDPQLMDSLELDVDYFREEFERRGFSRRGVSSRYPRQGGGNPFAAAINVPFDPDLHPRGRDGKFIESLGMVRLFDFTDRRGNRHSEAVGRVTEIVPDRNNPGNPDIEVELPQGGHVSVKPNQVSSAPLVKGRLEGEERAPTFEEAEDLLDREAAQRLVDADTPDVDVVDLEEDIYYADTIYNTSRDVGSLMVGDEIILPGDIPGTIVEFEFPGDRPDSVRVHTDGGTYHGKTTDILANYRPGEEVNPIGEPVMQKPGELGSKNNPIKTSDPLEAVKALHDGKFVELESVEQVSTLLNELADIAADAKAKGEDAPTYDLCLVSVPGTNLFCAESKGVPRIEMPQLSGFPVPGSKADSLPRTEEGGVDIGPAFMDHLRSQGVGVTEERRLAANLKASQSELIGSKIAGMMRAMDSGNEFAIRNIRENPIFVTSDGYVIDGHHRWAAVVGWDSLEGDLDDYDMPVRVIDMDIMEVLSEANKFANEFGIPQVSSSDVGPEIKQVNPPTESQAFRARSVDLDLAAEMKANRAKALKANEAELSRMAEMNRRE